MFVALTQKQIFMFAGIGLSISGIVTMFFVYQGLQSTDRMDEQATGNQNNSKFQLEEVHANPRLVMHIHAQLELWRSGEKQEVPMEIGIARELWNNHSLDQFGPSTSLLSPIHTHDSSGTIHIESVVHRNYTIGEFLSIWGSGVGKIVKVTDGEGRAIENYQDQVLSRNAKFVIESGD